eukprot:scaffold21207_cov124-Isochrysis_galbana.AAC.2
MVAPSVQPSCLARTGAAPRTSRLAHSSTGRQRLPGTLYLAARCPTGPARRRANRPPVRAGTCR